MIEEMVAFLGESGNTPDEKENLINKEKNKERQTFFSETSFIFNFYASCPSK